MTFPGMRGPQTFTDIVNAEADAVTAGTATGCAFDDPGCHGALTCVRAQHDATAPHVGRNADNQLIQWMPPCPPEPTGGTP